MKNTLRRVWIVVVAGLVLSFAGGAQAGMVVLDAADANGFGDNGGMPFLFSFSSSAPAFEFALLEFVDYDGLGIEFTDDTGFSVSPLIAFFPAESISGQFMGTTGNYTAHVQALGADGAFGLEVRAIDAVPGPSVPEPATLALFGLGLVGVGFAKRRKS